MNVVEQLKAHSPELGNGIEKKLISDLEVKLGINLPADFKKYLLELNYAELYDDPIYGIHKDKDFAYLDLYTTNISKEHFRYGFLKIFSNDLDGAVFIRPDSGAVYNAHFTTPLAASFTKFVEYVLEG